MHTAESVLARFLDTVAGNDPDAIAGCFAADAVYTNVPQPPLVGRDAIREMFARAGERASQVRWDVVSAAYDGNRGWLERVDHFWVNGVQVSVECNGVFVVDLEQGLLTEVRDYLDFGEYRKKVAEAWRARERKRAL